MKKITSSGAIISSLFASACCILPVLLAGVAGIAGVASFFERLRPFFILIVVIFLAYGFYVAYFQKKKECAPRHWVNTDSVSFYGQLLPLLWLLLRFHIGFNFYKEEMI